MRVMEEADESGCGGRKFISSFVAQLGGEYISSARFMYHELGSTFRVKWKYLRSYAMLNIDVLAGLHMSTCLHTYLSGLPCLSLITLAQCYPNMARTIGG